MKQTLKIGDLLKNNAFGYVVEIKNITSRESNTQIDRSTRLFRNMGSSPEAEIGTTLACAVVSAPRDSTKKIGEKISINDWMIAQRYFSVWFKNHGY